MPEFPPNDEEIHRMLAQDAATSERNFGAEDLAAYRASLRERSRRMASLSGQFDTVMTVFSLLLMIVLALVFWDALNIG